MSPSRTNSKRHTRTRRAKAVAFALACLTGGMGAGACGVGDLVNVGNNAVSVLQTAIQDLDINSAQWQEIVRGVITDLPATENDIKADVDEILQRALGGAQTELIATADFFARRMKTGLERQLAKLLNQPFIEPPPAFINFVPDKIEVARVNSNDLNSVTIFGYDFDKKDPQGQGLKLFILNGTVETPLSDSLLALPTHYKAVFNLGSSGVPLTPGTNLLILKWNGQPISTLAVIQPPPPTPKETLVNLSSISYIPPHTRGDQDYDGNGPAVELEARLIAGDGVPGGVRNLYARVYMKAKETESDWTTAEGASEWKVVYTAPPGAVITALLGPTTSEATYTDTNHTADTIAVGDEGTLVKRFVCVGDTSSDYEAGNATGVNVIFNKYRIMLLKPN